MSRKPLDQGDLDGFCGIYSIINALTLLFPSAMGEGSRAHVFKVIAKAVVSKWPGPIWDGTTEKDIRAMLAAAHKDFKETFKWEQPFRYHDFASFDDFKRELKWRIQGDNAFAIVGISKPWEHWTCAHRLTEREMIVTDSCKVKQIALAKCGFAGDGTDYEFDYHQTFTLMKG
jgi:hypothetical protein